MFECQSQCQANGDHFAIKNLFLISVRKFSRSNFLLCSTLLPNLLLLSYIFSQGQQLTQEVGHLKFDLSEKEKSILGYVIAYNLISDLQIILVSNCIVYN